MTQRIAWLSKKNIQKSFFHFVFLDNRRKTILSEGSLNLNLKDVLQLKQKTTLFPDSDIYIYIYIYIYTQS